MKKGGKTWWHLQSLCEKISFFPLYFPSFFFPVSLVLEILILIQKLIFLIF